jgi:hypothetical protein
MKTTKNQSVKEKEAVKINAAKNNLEKLKCIKNTVTGKVQRVPVSVANEIIKDDNNWHFTNKSSYEAVLINAIPKGVSVHPNSFTGKPKGKVKGVRRDNTQKQVIIEKKPNPDYQELTFKEALEGIKEIDVNKIPIYGKSKEIVSYKSKVNEPKYDKWRSPIKDTSTTIKVKVPSETPGKIVGYKYIPKFITTIKTIYHLIVDGKQVKPLLK